MPKKTGKTAAGGVSWHRLAWWLIGALVVIVLGIFALSRGGKVSLTPKKVEITTTAPKATATPEPDVAQTARATGDKARAANAAGNINEGQSAARTAGDKADSKPANGKVRQEAVASGTGSEALNAGGNINLE
ncbi:hypothetical protein [Massilia sp. METH4]|uniref:hypothetical protein n=1 Tax=Massilia sp. METH4 TaxID=3123041 RepID=UPI0030CD6759